MHKKKIHARRIFINKSIIYVSRKNKIILYREHIYLSFLFNLKKVQSNLNSKYYLKHDLHR